MLCSSIYLELFHYLELIGKCRVRILVKGECQLTDDITDQISHNLSLKGVAILFFALADILNGSVSYLIHLTNVFAVERLQICAKLQLHLKKVGSLSRIASLEIKKETIFWLNNAWRL